MISKDKQYRTRDGREVRVYATDGIEGRSVHGAVMCSHGWVGHCWTKDGRNMNSFNQPEDLVEIRPRHKRTIYVNVCKSACHYGYDTRSDAQAAKCGDRQLALVAVNLDFEEGEGL